MAGFYGCLQGKNSDCSIMASGPSDVLTNQDPADTTEECTGKKKSKFQTFKNLFAKKKRKEAVAPAGGDSGLKCSLSSDNVNSPEPALLIRSEKDKGSGSKINMGNKALSHDSVFVSESPVSEVTEGLGVSQDSVHRKVKSLQAIRLGSPPSLCVKKMNDAGTLSEDDGLPCSPPEYSTLHTVLAGVSHRPSKLVQRNSSLSLEGTDSDEDQMSCEAGFRSVSPLVLLPVDFSQPASPMGCLDNTVARHRLAVRHKACTKTRKPTNRVDGRAEGESFQEERLNFVIPESVEEDEEEDVKCEQAGAVEEEEEEEEEEETDGVVVSQQAERSAPDEEEEDKQGDQQEVSQDAPSPSIQNDSDSEECLSGQAEAPAPRLQTQTAPLLGSLKSLEPPTGDDDFLLAPPGCEVAVEEGSLLQQVLSSLKGPLTSVLGLEIEAVLLEVEVNKEGSEAESGVAELASDPQEEARLPSDGPDCPAKPQEELEGEPYESEEELLVEHFKPKEEEAEEINPEYLTKEDQDMPSVGKEEEEGAEVEEEEAEEVVEDERREEEDRIEVVSEVPVQTALLEPEEEEDVTPTSVEDDFQQVPDNDRDPERACESLECPTELPDQTVTDQACVSQLPNISKPPPESLDQPEAPAHTTQDQEKPSVTTDQPCITSPSAAADPEQSPQEHCSGPTATEDPGSEQSRPRFTIAPAWQRLATKELTSPSPSSSPSLAVPGAGEAKRDPPSGVEPLSPVGAEVPASPSPTRSTTAPIMPPEDTPPALQEEGTPENLFGVRLRKTSVGMLRLGPESETPPASPAHPLPMEPQRASSTEPQPNSKPALPRKPSELDGMIKPKRTPDLSVGRVPSGGSSGGSQSPSWISVAKHKQRILKENSLEETTENKVPAETEEPNREMSIRTLTSPVNKDQAKPPGSPVKVSCSLEISKPVVVEKEGKRAPTALAQDEPPWLALAKKKAKAWSEMPQIVQ